MGETSMVERVAKAICAANGNDPDTEQSPGAGPEWLYYQDDARAAIAAMREPTEEMVNASYDAAGYTTDCPKLEDCWRASIDTALAEKAHA